MGQIRRKRLNECTVCAGVEREKENEKERERKERGEKADHEAKS